jgi:hypothetical protein
VAKIQTEKYGTVSILPVPAEAPVKETLNFLTDVMISYNGTEDRIALRKFARTRYSYTIPMDPSKVAGIFNSLYGSLRELWAVPLWTEAQRVTLEANAFRIECDTVNFDIDVSLPLLLWTDCGQWQVVQPNSVDQHGVLVSLPVTGMRSCWLVPLRLGRINGDALRHVNGYNGSLDITFDLIDLPFHSNQAPEQYKGEDIYFDPWILDGDSSLRKVQKREDSLDLDLGPVTVRSPWLHSRHTTPFKVILDNRADIHNHKQWLYRRAGRFKAFWLPSFESNLVLTSTGQLSTVLTIRSDGFKSHYERRHIAVRTAGAWLPREIETAVQLSEDVVQLTLTQALNVAAKDIIQICYLGLNRLSGDRVEINWIGNNVVMSSVELVEIEP